MRGGWSQGNTDCDDWVVLTDYCSQLLYNNVCEPFGVPGRNKQTNLHDFHLSSFQSVVLVSLKVFEASGRIGPSLLFYASSVHPNERKYVFGKLELHFFHPEANSQQPHPNSLSC